MEFSKQSAGLSKSYGDTVALRNLNFKVASRDVCCLLGQYGAGKTTTTNIFSGRIEATSGEALANGFPVINTEVVSKEITYRPSLYSCTGRCRSARIKHCWDYGL